MRFPNFSQLNFTDCGPTCLKIILKYYGKNCSLEYLKNICPVTRSGISLGDILNAARILGFSATPVKVTTDSLKKNLHLPCILHWRSDHFVVLYKISKSDYYYISDPGFGRLKLSTAEFESLWKDKNKMGVALNLIPSESLLETNFPYSTPGNELKKTIEFVKINFKGHYGKLSLLSALLLFGAFLLYLLPLTMQRLIDHGVNQKSLSVVYQVFFIQIAIILGQTAGEWFKGVIRVKFSMHVSVNIIKNLLNKLVKLPLTYFDTKLNTDILQRIEDQQKIESFLTQKITQAIFSLVLIVIFSVLLASYNIRIFYLFFGLSCFSFIWISLFLNKRKNIDYYTFKLAADNRNSLTEIIQGMKEIKINNAQSRKISLWTDIQREYFKLKIRSLNLNLYQTIGVGTITQVKNILITCSCAIWVINGKFTLGELLSVSYISGMMSAPMESLVDFIQTGQEAKLSFDRIDEVHQKSDENAYSDSGAPISPAKGIYFNDVSFKYEGSFNPYVLSNLSLSIPIGKTTAIVGSSGSGKTTLLKLLLKFYDPQIGDIYIDDLNMKDINSDSWRECCGTVMQDGYIFSGTIADNIALAEVEPDLNHLDFSLKTACLDQFVSQLPLGLNTKIGSGGSDLSGGQKQRILIARAVYKNPQFLFFDEATSSLDAKNERDIMENLNTFLAGKTVVVVAHRLSTVKNADQIIVLDAGKIVEVGSHETLAKNQKYYYSLIKNQLELGS
ncbi:peptidase domain-containing ABC transporter [Mucilaginibacter jinjuensis]|uniref:Peptidase domain-containing ABC transporter n=1 Tax=Mucilaginibacter jinjuensis TaxID=1176721 RepID=A0ABY7TCV7_9SPHI|nr:peptidase domain-containing ABC transporter [Mucilaginibacter jinjuensis]WCT14354.1 peptidase domain-containing ABC transporter [Mucilaginibacter jinjuensis]